MVGLPRSPLFGFPFQMNALELRGALSSGVPLLLFFCKQQNGDCDNMEPKMVEAMIGMRKEADRRGESLTVAYVDVGTNDLPIGFNASGVRVWGNYNIPPEYLALPLTGYHYFRYFNVPAIYLAKGNVITRFVGSLETDQELKRFVWAGDGHISEL
eukprot:TRINITY_DN22412_c0_g1_i1.p1 TRINITY_DN22412_c0_g1~~TRINITY_DN22412_c0_g1_i1.p1  ORF type:complete len:156 (+),score=18.93 TRINITY_DN22412_c0_g1_i1:204-671(+)